MDPLTYLEATRSHFQVIEDGENRFAKYVSVVRSILNDDDLQVLFIRSNTASTELVVGSEPWVIIDRQAELYFTAMAFPEVFWKGDSRYDEYLWDSYCYVAAAELALRGDEGKSEALLSHSKGSANLNQRESIFSELARLHFTIFHEQAHASLSKSEDMKRQVFGIVDQVFFELMGEISFIDPRSQAWTDDVKEECAVDYLSFAQFLGLIEHDDMAKIASGGPEVFSLQSLICIHQISMIKKLKDALEAGNSDDALIEPNVDPITLRLRVTRRIFNQMNTQILGEEHARIIHDQFSAYLERTHDNLSKIFPERLRTLVSSMGKVQANSAIHPFEGKFSWT